MNSGATAERVYDALKHRILHAHVRPGARLDPAVLAELLVSSVTPVRDALHMLTGEGLVETRIGEGFHLPQVDEPGLKDLYAWNAAILILACRGWRPMPPARPASAPDESADSADQTAALFLRIARHSTNAEHGRAIVQANDRLHAARRVEALILPDIGSELAQLATACEQTDMSGIRQLLSAYHRRRVRVAAEVVRQLYRAGDVEPPI
ncbi:GntR family transcriptional regulator [Sphingomonas sp. So64.6b]|uniref:GntR family transcriptional regulator n=1 Tax=Sphingomonas sp. So64.6b TaxID=2997354 RepID=UPI0015FFA987|nr:GntR family transcriptional regulator [Sphingomonas sp. So64.6b]QNA83756.1 GntR family transcriptional regulator [Sphingomonas sp. So64.6b]